MNKNEIFEEIISKINIELDEYLFYIPGETITGKINLIPEYKIKIANNKLHLNLILQQYEFWERTDIELSELNNIYKTEVQKKSIEYILKDNILKEKNAIFGKDSFFIIEKEKEEEKNILSIPFEFKIEKNNEKLLPTFQYEKDNYILGIRHLLIVKCEEYSTKNYTGLFIGKEQNPNLKYKKEIKENFKIGFSNINVILEIPKESYSFEDELDLKIKTDANLTFKKVTKIENIIYRKIEWKGYLKNSILEKKEILKNEEEYNNIKKKYGLIDLLSVPITPIRDAIMGALAGPIIYSFLGAKPLKDGIPLKERILGGLYGGIIGPFKGLYYGMAFSLIENKNIIKENFNIGNYENTFDNNIKINQKVFFNRIKQFVYFKNDKIVGFIKFINDIIPPVNGYFFKCDYYFKSNINIEGVILNSEKSLKIKLNFYDGIKYIQEMKKLTNIKKLDEIIKDEITI